MKKVKNMLIIMLVWIIPMMSYGATPALEVKDYPAGDIGFDAVHKASDFCPRVCSDVNRQWDGNWTNRNRIGQCGCVKVNRYTIFNNRNTSIFAEKKKSVSTVKFVESIRTRSIYRSNTAGSICTSGCMKYRGTWEGNWSNDPSYPREHQGLCACDMSLPLNKITCLDAFSHSQAWRQCFSDRKVIKGNAEFAGELYIDDVGKDNLCNINIICKRKNIEELSRQVYARVPKQTLPFLNSCNGVLTTESCDKLSFKPSEQLLKTEGEIRRIPIPNVNPLKK